LDLKDIALLYRTNAQSRSLEDALRRNSIPYVIIGGLEFYKRKEIKDVLSYLRVITNPRDEESLLRVINYPVRGIGETSVAKIAEYARSLAVEKRSLYGALCDVKHIESLNDRAKTAVGQFVKLIEKYRQLRAELSAAELAHALVGELELLTKFKEEATPESLARWENVQELLSALTEFCAEREDATLENFLEEVSLVSDADQNVDERNAVTLMTLHAAKGLEFPIVFITGLEDGLLPFYQSATDPSELEEERRLFYVGITRAMQKLFLTYARSRYRMGELTFPVLSRFAVEIDQSLIENDLSSSPSRPAPVSVHDAGHSARSPRKRTMTVSPDPIPDYENESQEHQSLRVGAFVVHESFGRGKVIQLAGRGDAAKAVVHFDSVGRKNLMLKFAHLRVA
jgi:DNA helicase-2/ATP-dependent DNA helicase PcrA